MQVFCVIPLPLSLPKVASAVFAFRFPLLPRSHLLHPSHMWELSRPKSQMFRVDFSFQHLFPWKIVISSRGSVAFRDVLRHRVY